MKNSSTKPVGQKPAWLKRRLPTGRTYENVRKLLDKSCLHTVCQEAKCPNLWECFSKETATFLIMGPRCTRNCRFCAVDHGPMPPLDPGEPARIAEAVNALNLEYVVVTSVTKMTWKTAEPVILPTPFSGFERAILVSASRCSYRISWGT